MPFLPPLRFTGEFALPDAMRPLLRRTQPSTHSEDPTVNTQRYHIPGDATQADTIELSYRTGLPSAGQELQYAEPGLSDDAYYVAWLNSNRRPGKQEPVPLVRMWVDTVTLEPEFVSVNQQVYGCDNDGNPQKIESMNRAILKGFVDRLGSLQEKAFKIVKPPEPPESA